MMMDIVELAKKCGAIEDLNNEYPTYLNHHIKFNVKILGEFSKKLTEDKDVEIQTLRAKVTSVEVLVEALREIERRDCYCDGGESCKNNYQAIASNAIATYEKINEVKE